MKTFEMIAVEVEEISRRRVIFVHEFGLRLPAFRSQHDVPNSPVAGHRSTLGQTETLQTVHDPRRVRGVTFPVLCQ